MNRSALCAATVIVFGLSAHAAFADDFNSVGPTSILNMAPTGWAVINGGSVDWIAKGNPFSITCFNNSQGCVDLDGTTGKAGLLETLNSFNFVAGQTYALSAEVSGNQRGGSADDLEFGFLQGKTATALASKTVTGIPSTSGFTLYTLLYTATASGPARAFFYNVGGADDIGPILDNVSVKAVPLPAAAWLMLSGLAAVAAVARRRTTKATA